MQFTNVQWNFYANKNLKKMILEINVVTGIVRKTQTDSKIFGYDYGLF